MLELLKVGLSIAGIGMGFVLAFLCILIFSMHFMAKILKIIEKFFPEPVVEVASQKKIQSGDNGIIAAVIAAAKRYR